MRRDFWHPELQCRIKSLSYDYNQGVGLIITRRGDVTHMPGAIRVFTALDKRAWRIIATDNHRTHMIYERSADGKGDWEAYPADDAANFPRCFALQVEPRRGRKRAA
jgi:hypothetical protein